MILHVNKPLKIILILVFTIGFLLASCKREGPWLIPTESYIKQLEDPNWRNRLEAVQVLGRRGEEATVYEALEKATHDSNPGVAERARIIIASNPILAQKKTEMISSLKRDKIAAKAIIDKEELKAERMKKANDRQAYKLINKKLDSNDKEQRLDGYRMLNQRTEPLSISLIPSLLAILNNENHKSEWEMVCRQLIKLENHPPDVVPRLSELARMDYSVATPATIALCYFAPRTRGLSAMMNEVLIGKDAKIVYEKQIQEAVEDFYRDNQDEEAEYCAESFDQHYADTRRKALAGIKQLGIGGLTTAETVAGLLTTPAYSAAVEVLKMYSREAQFVLPRLIIEYPEIYQGYQPEVADLIFSMITDSSEVARIILDSLRSDSVEVRVRAIRAAALLAPHDSLIVQAMGKVLVSDRKYNYHEIQNALWALKESGADAKYAAESLGEYILLQNSDSHENSKIMNILRRLGRDSEPVLISLINYFQQESQYPDFSQRIKGFKGAFMSLVYFTEERSIPHLMTMLLQPDTTLEYLPGQLMQSWALDGLAAAGDSVVVCREQLWEYVQVCEEYRIPGVFLVFKNMGAASWDIYLNSLNYPNKKFRTSMMQLAFPNRLWDDPAKADSMLVLTEKFIGQQELVDQKVLTRFRWNLEYKRDQNKK